MLRAWLIAAALAGWASGAPAAEEPPPVAMANVIGNTLISKNPQGVESRIRYKADGTFAGSVPSLGFRFGGRWKVEGDQVCRTYRPAIPNRPNPECSPTLPWLQLGQTFQAPNGAVVSLVEGAK